MDYIILDLEWDSAFFVPEKRFVNQILQIGAVKLDKSFNIVSTFERTVKSDISKRVTGRFSALTGITNEKMRSGVPLLRAVKDFNKWVGKNAVIMTWSTSDLYTVIENEKYLIKKTRFKIEKYLDLQSFVQNEMRLLGFEISSQISLSSAATQLGVTLDGLELHTAKDDSVLCALLLKKLYNADRFLPLIKDTKKDKTFERIKFKPYFISDINDERIDKDILNFRCDVCGSNAERTTKWQFRNNRLTAKFLCKECGRKFMGRVSAKVTFDGVNVRTGVGEIKAKPPEEKSEHDALQSVSEKV